MILQNCFPDFITVDGAEDRTGAAPLEFSDGVEMPFEPALTFVNNTLIKLDIRNKIRVICIGKIISGYRILRAVAMVRICATVQEVLCFHWVVLRHYDATTILVLQELLLKIKC
jgi:hypothetical protein